MNDMSEAAGADKLSALEALIVDEPRFQELEERLDQFCPFAALGMEDAEIRHGNFLATMLSPQKPHGFGSSLLRSFLTAAVRKGREAELANPASITPLDIHLSGLDDALVYREWKNIDLVVVAHNEQIVAAIELKINSSQGVDQLARYRQRIDKEWPDQNWKKLYIFLTKHDELPQGDEAGWWIPFRIADALMAIEPISNDPSADDLARSSLQAYISMMKRRHMTNVDMERIASELWARHEAALNYLISMRPDNLGRLFEEIAINPREMLCVLPDEENWQLDSSGANVVRFAYKPWDQIPGFCESSGWSPASNRFLLFQVQREDQKVLGTLYLGPSRSNSREAREAIETVVKPLRSPDLRKRFGKDWACLDRKVLFDPAEMDIDGAKAEIEVRFAEFAKAVIERVHPPLANAFGLEGMQRGQSGAAHG